MGVDPSAALGDGIGSVVTLGDGGIHVLLPLRTQSRAWPHGTCSFPIVYPRSQPPPKNYNTHHTQQGAAQTDGSRPLGQRGASRCL